MPASPLHPQGLDFGKLTSAKMEMGRRDGQAQTGTKHSPPRHRARAPPIFGARPVTATHTGLRWGTPTGPVRLMSADGGSQLSGPSRADLSV